MLITLEPAVCEWALVQSECKVIVVVRGRAAKKEPGFVQYDLHQSQDRPDGFGFYEVSEDERALNAHNNTDAMKAFGAQNAQLFNPVELKEYNRNS